jgi:hypothetical protein
MPRGGDFSIVMPLVYVLLRVVILSPHAAAPHPRRMKRRRLVGSALAGAFVEGLDGEPVSLQAAPRNASAKADPAMKVVKGPSCFFT